MKELISIIIPVYNAALFLERTVQSIITQTYKDIEILLVDDGSSDNSMEIARRLAAIDARVKPLPKKHEGVTAARHHGVVQAQGNWVVFVDADDTLPNDAVEFLHAQTEEQQIDLVLGTWKTISPSSSRNGLIPLKGLIPPGKYIHALLSGDAPAGILGKIIRREALLNSSALDLPAVITNNEDLLMNIKLTSALRKIKICPDQVVYHYIKRKDSVSQKVLSVSQWDVLFQELKQILEGRHNSDYWNFIAVTMTRQTMHHTNLDFRKSVFFDEMKRHASSLRARLLIRYLQNPKQKINRRTVSAILLLGKIKKLSRCLCTQFLR